MRRVRFKLKTMIAAILCVALAMHIALSGWRLYSAKSHGHTAIIINNGTLGAFTWFKRPTFWPNYWRSVLGISISCERDGRFLAERCELETPETLPYRVTMGFTTDHSASYRITPDLATDQIELCIESIRELGHDARCEDGRIMISYRPAQSVPAGKP